MSARAISWVWEYSRAKRNQRFVLLTIAHHDDDDGCGASPSTGQLAAMTGMTERAVRAAVIDLCALGELDVILGSGGRHRYHVIMRTDQAPCTDEIKTALDV